MFLFKAYLEKLYNFVKSFMWAMIRLGIFNSKSNEVLRF